jgi:hypothetical protein
MSSSLLDDGQPSGRRWVPAGSISFMCGANRVYGRENENRPTGFVAGDKLRSRNSVRRGGLLDLSGASGITTQ